jgi:hypothetical protein
LAFVVSESLRETATNRSQPLTSPQEIPVQSFSKRTSPLGKNVKAAIIVSAPFPFL